VYWTSFDKIQRAYRRKKTYGSNEHITRQCHSINFENVKVLPSGKYFKELLIKTLLVIESNLYLIIMPPRTLMNTFTAHWLLKCACLTRKSREKAVNLDEIREFYINHFPSIRDKNTTELPPKIRENQGIWFPSLHQCKIFRWNSPSLRKVLVSFRNIYWMKVIEWKHKLLNENGDYWIKFYFLNFATHGQPYIVESVHPQPN